jgi:hypothetical protein
MLLVELQIHYFIVYQKNANKQYPEVLLNEKHRGGSSNIQRS